MKKFLLLTLLLFMAACDFGTDPKNDVPRIDTVFVHDTIRPNDTTKKIVKKSVVVNDTDIFKTHTLNISGKISEKNTSGKTIGGFSSAVVCLENSGKCVKPNSSGIYSFAPLKTSSIKFVGRMLAESDTTNTPEGFVADTAVDSSVNVDTTIVRDTLISNDTVYITDTTIVNHDIVVDSNASLSDTVVIYTDSRVLYEIPVTSWKTILPDNYVVQRNISGQIKKNEYISEVSNAEAIFWGIDSLALRIPLELSNDKSAYSGFVYQPYDDSSFKFSIKNKNIFVRVLDGNDSVFGMTDIVSYSERAGDLSVFLTPIIPGSIQKYPRPNKFIVIKDGDNVSRIVNTQNIPVVGFVNIDSIFLRNMWKDTVKNRTYAGLGYDTRIEFSTFDSLSKQIFSKLVDSVSVEFESDNEDSIFVQTSWENCDGSGCEYKYIYPIIGKNVYFTKWNPTLFNKNNTFTFTLHSQSAFVKNPKVFVKFKQ